MEKRKYSKQFSIFIWFLLSVLFSQNLLVTAFATTTTTSSYQDQKNCYTPDPRATPPPVSHGSPPHGSEGSGGTPPYHPTPPTPSGGHCSCNPPHNVPTPSTPPRGGGYYPPSTPSTPSTPTPRITPPTPVPVITPPTPTVPSPFIPDPNSPYSCNYWRNHPAIIWGVLGWWGTVGSAFGVTSLPGIPSTMTLPQALSNTRTDGYGTLYREATAAFLNSMFTRNFPFTTSKIRESFVSALQSNKAAASQGQIFKLANEGRLKFAP